MSAPNQEEWKATRDEMEEIHGIMEFQGKGRGLDHDLLWLEARRIVNAVAGRRALAELRALAKMFCVHCAAGVEFVRLRDEIGKWDGHQHNPSELWDCDALHIHDRIAEIEAEEA